MIFIQLDRNSATSLTQQLYKQLQLKIVDGELPSGYRLPASRKLADELKVSRNLVTEVYETLNVEGFIESRPGSGSFVASGAMLKGFTRIKPESEVDVKVATRTENDSVHFYTGIPEYLFPKGAWGRCLRDAALYADKDLYGYGYNESIPDLQKALRKWLGIHKGIQCSSEQILIFPGTHAAVALLLSVFSDRPGPAVIEDPSLPSLHSVISGFGRKITYISGNQKNGDARNNYSEPEPCFVLITPSHSYPMGEIMTVQRRIELLELLDDSVPIIENDYDGELIYNGPVVSSMHLLAPDRVIHTGSMNGTLYPGLKMAYMVVPGKFVDRVSKAKVERGCTCPSLEQLALARFIESNEYDKHVIKLKKHYSKQYRFLNEELNRIFKGKMEISGIGSGQYITLRFPGLDLRGELRRKLEKAGFYCQYGWECSVSPELYKDVMVLCFGMLTRVEITKGIEILKSVLL